MNTFEKAAIGIARADQLGKKAENISNLIGFAVFGVIALGMMAFVYKMSKEKKKQELVSKKQEESQNT